MRCPGCGHPQDHVVDSRSVHNATAIRRRRECASCGRRFTTYERVEEAMPLIVKRDDRREPYSRKKLTQGLLIACRKRPVGTQAIESLVDDVERALLTSGKRELPSAAVGEAVMEGLAELDQVAYIRFASVYHSFADIDAFARLLTSMRSGAGAERQDSTHAAMSEEP